VSSADWPLQVYAFSLENWQRDASEVTFLMDLFQSALQQQLPELQANGVRLKFMGQLHRLPEALQQQCRSCEAATADNTGLLLTVAVSYSAQEDMAQAVQQLAQQVQAGTLEPQQVSQVSMCSALGSHPGSIPQHCTSSTWLWSTLSVVWDSRQGPHATMKPQQPYTIPLHPNQELCG
jgi:undecaprenyl diphosphate synthase